LTLLRGESLQHRAALKDDAVQATLCVFVSKLFLTQHNRLTRGDAGDEPRVQPRLGIGQFALRKCRRNKYAGAETHNLAPLDRFVRFDRKSLGGPSFQEPLPHSDGTGAAHQLVPHALRVYLQALLKFRGPCWMPGHHRGLPIS
jgi:hypothetical protein